MVITKKCSRCNHEWALRGKTDPTACPKCKSPYWNKKRVRPFKPKDTIHG